MRNHLIAMGDSLTEGIGDEVMEVPLRSWVSHFAELYQPAMSLTNLAKRGLVSRDIRATQLEKAIALKPDLVTLIAGGNDVLKGYWNHEQYRTDMEFMIQQILKSTDALIITSNLPDFTLRLPLPSEKKQAVKGQTLQANEIIQSLSEEYGLCLLDFWSHPLSKDPAIWSQDGTHPNSIGYREMGSLVYHHFEQWQQERNDDAKANNK